MRNTFLAATPLAIILLAAPPAVATTAPEPAAADAPTQALDEATSPAFGRRGDLVLQSGSGFSFSRARPKSSGHQDHTSGSVTAAVDLFVTDRMTVGLLGGYSGVEMRGLARSDQGSREVTSKIWSATAGLALGTNWALNRWASFWPRLTAALTREWVASDSLVSRGRAHDDRFHIALSAPVLLHPVPHFFFGAGPILFVEGSSFGDGALVNVAGGPYFTVGGWL